MKKVFLEVCFWLALICLAVFVNSQTNADSLKTSGPISVHKNGSGTYTVSVFGRKSFDEKFASVSKYGHGEWSILKVSDGKTDSYWTISPKPSSDDEGTEAFPYYIGGGYDFRESVQPDTKIPHGQSPNIKENSGKPIFGYNTFNTK